MPKEKVFDIHNDAEFVAVGWSRDGYVQIATVNPLGEISMQGNRIDDIDPGWFIDMDRRSINDLIRLLRNARDAAFGRDE